MVDYKIYQLSKREYLIAVGLSGSVFFIIGLVFFKMTAAALVLSAFGFFYPKIRKQELLVKRKEELNNQFKQALYILSSSLGAGRSVESAFRESLRDLEVVYPLKETYIIREFELINKRLYNGESIERALQDLSQRAGLEDIKNFTDVFLICKRTGGNLVEVMRNTANIIGEKMAIQQEISVMIAQKRFESKILMAAPLLFIALLTYSSPDYMAPLYQGKGIMVMLCALVMLVICYLINKKIMNIEV
jgi:tight adherence protein B